jgi:hypothetical protein
MRLTFTNSDNFDEVLHWRCEFLRDTDVIWIPVPYDDLLLNRGESNTSLKIRRPISAIESSKYPKGTLLYGTRMSINSFIRLHSQALESEHSNLRPVDLTSYAQSIDDLLSANKQSINITSSASSRTVRRRLQEVCGMSPSKFRSLIYVHDFLSTECSYGSRKTTLTNSINADTYYDQSHFNRNFNYFFGSNPSQFLRNFNGLPEQLLTISYKYLPDFHDIIKVFDNKEMQ